VGIFKAQRACIFFAKLGLITALGAGAMAQAKPGEPPVSKAVYLKDETMSPLPDHVRAALTNREAGDYYYVTDYQIRPKIYRKVGRSRYDGVALAWLKPRSDLSTQEQRCYYVFLSGSPDCLSARQLGREIASVDPQKSDLLKWSRSSALKIGLTQTRDLLVDLMRRRDPEGGAFETRLRQAAANARWRAADAVVADASLNHSRTGIFFFLGIDVSDHSPNRDQIREASNYARKLGFVTHTFETGPADSSKNNAAQIAAQMAQQLAKVDRAIFVGASKGVADFLHWVFLHSQKLGAEERAKLKIFISLSGSVRESFVADWLMNVRRTNAELFRTMMEVFKRDAMPGIESLSHSPWVYAPKSTSLRDRFPQMRWVSFAMIPEALDGMSYLDEWNLMFQEHVYREARYRAPSDGLMETAASLLPPGTGVREYVVRGFGPHALSLGNFVDGKKIAPRTQTGKSEPQPAAGVELIDAFLRSIPSTWIK
jgi:hypothetical protein